MTDRTADDVIADLRDRYNRNVVDSYTIHQRETLLLLRHIDALRAERDAARAEIAALLGAPEWQPLATMPSDESPIWIVGGNWREPTKRKADGHWYRSGTLQSPPTHWAPDFGRGAPSVRALASAESEQ